MGSGWRAFAVAVCPAYVQHVRYTHVPCVCVCVSSVAAARPTPLPLPLPSWRVFAFHPTLFPSYPSTPLPLSFHPTPSYFHVHHNVVGYGLKAQKAYYSGHDNIAHDNLYS